MRFTAKCALVFFAMLATDAVQARWTLAVSNRDASTASLWTALIVFLGAAVTVSYARDNRLIVPAALGAALGVYLALLF